MIGSLYGSSDSVPQIPQLPELYRTGRLRLDGLLWPEYRLADINEAFARLAAEPVGRGLIPFGDS